MNDFIKAAEDFIFLALDGPIFYKTTTTATAASTNAKTLAAGVIDVISIRLCETAGESISTGGPFRYLLRKDIDFMYEAFPGTSPGGLETGVPKYYSVTGTGVSSNDPTLSIRMGPTPDAIYNMEIEYYGKAKTDSITSGSTVASPLTTETWLSVTHPDVLMWGSVLQAYTYMKGDPQILGSYDKQFQQGIMMLKNMTESRQDRDTYAGDGGPTNQQG